jgi:Bacterial Ig domain
MANETFTAIQTTVATPGFDADNDGVIDPGEQVTTTVTITNNSTTPTPVDATDVQFTEDLNGMTLVNQAGDDINASPIAFNDSGYTTAGNVPFTTVVSVLANDAEPLGPEGLLLNAGTTIQNTGTFASAFGGSVTLNADGTFTYISAVGFEGTDTFTYTLRDTGLDAIAGNADDLTDTGTVSITVGPAVWFIDNTAAPGGNGTVRNASRQETAYAGNCLRRDAISPGNTMCWTEPSSMKKRRSQRVTTHIFLPRVLHSLESTETTRWIPPAPRFSHTKTRSTQALAGVLFGRSAIAPACVLTA